MAATIDLGERWFECDHHDDAIARIDCRTSRLNDGYHIVDRRLAQVEFQQRFLLGGAVSSVVAGVVMTLRFLHDVGVFKKVRAAQDTRPRVCLVCWRALRTGALCSHCGSAPKRL